MVITTSSELAEATPPQDQTGSVQSGEVKPALLIAGSRSATPAMLTYARKAVERAGERQMRILVGDNPQGVDRAVVAACDEFGVECNVYGATQHPRNSNVKTSEHCHYIQVMGEEVKEIAGAVGTGFQRSPRPATYAERDRLMVDTAERVLCIWDGQSPGTKAVYEYAAEEGKTADLAMEQDGKLRIVQRTYEHNPTTPEPPPPNQVSEPPTEVPQESPITALNQPVVYTLGYAGRTHQEVEQLVESLDATLVDIRLSPRSGVPGFNKAQLKKSLDGRYLHMPEFGNDNYNARDEGIEIHDYAAGLAKLRDTTTHSERPLILMCGCKDAHTCHRTTVGQRLKEDGFDFRGDMAELGIQAPATQNTLPTTPTDVPTNPPIDPLPNEPKAETSTTLEIENAFIESCQAAGLGEQEIAEQRQVLLPFQALHELGVEPVEFNPSLDVPLMVKDGQALWVGVYQPEATNQDYAACLLSLSGIGDTDPQAHLAICYSGPYERAFDAAQDLLDAAQSGGPERCLGVAEGMARAYGEYETWSNVDGQPLDAHLATNLAQHSLAPSLDI